MKKTMMLWVVHAGLMVLFLLTGCSGNEMENNAPSQADTPAEVPPLDLYDNGFMSIRIPRGWQMHVAGSCSTLAFLVRDPQCPLRQIMFFGQIGPVYMSRQQKRIDWDYMNAGGYPVAYIEMPVIQPLTPGNFLRHFSEIADTSIARRFMPQCPRLHNLQIVHETPQATSVPGGQAARVRALFTKDGQVGEGLFSLTTAKLMPFMNGPGGGTGLTVMMAGITAPSDEFAQWLPVLLQALGSFNLTPAYVQQCTQMQDATWSGVMKAGQTLRETSDIIMQGWQQRNQTYDIIAEKQHDAILDKERLYDPVSGQVYEFDNGFYDQYRLNPQQYEQDNLQPLPDDNRELWTQPALDGYRHLRPQ